MGNRFRSSLLLRVTHNLYSFKGSANIPSIRLPCYGVKHPAAAAKLTLLSSSSWSVLTPNWGILELVRLELCMSFLTPLIWHMGCCRFFFSRSFCVGDGISTSFCLSEDEKRRHLREGRRRGAGHKDKRLQVQLLGLCEKLCGQTCMNFEIWAAVDSALGLGNY